MTHNVRRREQIDKHTKRVRKFEWHFSDFKERERASVRDGILQFQVYKTNVGKLKTNN